MRWIYGKQDFNTIARGQENGYLLTNGLGGFSSMTMTGSAARNDHAVLMACVQAPNHRYNVVHRLAETLRIGEELFPLSTQEFADGPSEEGYRYLSAFIYEGTPLWKFQLAGVEIHKEIGMKHGENTVAIRYRIQNRKKCPVTLEVTPFFQFTKKGEDLSPEQKMARRENAIASNGLELKFTTNGTVVGIEETRELYYYSYDVCDGRRETGSAMADHRISLTVLAEKEAVLKIVYSLEDAKQDADVIFKEMKQYQKTLKEQAGFRSPVACELAKSADAFVSRRESTGGSTILAGYPFFEDWGRDTMIALPGICIATGQYDTAKEILRTFAVHEQKGLMPNLFPEGGNEPLYNTVDAALLFVNCVYLYYEATKDQAFVEEMYPVMERILKGYREGTDYGIHMDEDGLILAGEGLWQVTWMDVRVGEIRWRSMHTGTMHSVLWSGLPLCWIRSGNIRD